MTAPWQLLIDLAEQIETDARRLRALPIAEADFADLLGRRKDDARVAVASALLALLGELRAAIGAAPLRGLPRLSRDSRSAWCGVRLRTKSPDEPLARPGRGEEWGSEGLCLTDRGRLVFARQNDSGDVNERLAGPSDLRAEDLPSVIEGVRFALVRAGQYAQDRAETLDATRALAERLTACLGGGR